MALAGTALVLAPDYRIMLFLLGEVKLKYIVLVIVLLDLVGIANQTNTGGHAAHIGGFLFGCFFVYRLRDGKDMSEWIDRILDTIKRGFSRRPRRQPNLKRRPQPAMKATTFGKAKGSAASDPLPFSFTGPVGCHFETSLSQTPRLRGEGCRRQLACAAGDGEGVRGEGAAMAAGRPVLRAPSPSRRFAPLVSAIRPKPSPRQRGEASACAPHRLSPLAFASTPADWPFPPSCRLRHPGARCALERHRPRERAKPHSHPFRQRACLELRGAGGRSRW